MEEAKLVTQWRRVHACLIRVRESQPGRIERNRGEHYEASVRSVGNNYLAGVLTSLQQWPWVNEGKSGPLHASPRTMETTPGSVASLDILAFSPIKNPRCSSAPLGHSLPSFGTRYDLTELFIATRLSFVKKKNVYPSCRFVSFIFSSIKILKNLRCVLSFRALELVLVSPPRFEVECSILQTF